MKWAHKFDGEGGGGRGFGSYLSARRARRQRWPVTVQRWPCRGAPLVVSPAEGATRRSVTGGGVPGRGAEAGRADGAEAGRAEMRAGWAAMAYAAWAAQAAAERAGHISSIAFMGRQRFSCGEQFGLADGFRASAAGFPASSAAAN